MTPRKWLLCLLATVLLTACSSPLDFTKEASYAVPMDANTSLGGLAVDYMEHAPNEGTGFYPLNDGQEALLARLALIHKAEKTIDLQYYIYRDDATSSLLTYALYLAAERGVRIRILLDDMQSRNDQAMASLSSHPNIELRLFNPFENRAMRMLGFVKDFDQSNRRMHNKSFIADSAFAIVGGRNIGDEYLAANNSVDFGDFDLMLLGKAVPDVSEQFDLYWNSSPASPVESLIDEPTSISQTDIAHWKESLNRHFKNSDYVASFTNLPLVKALNEETLTFFWGSASVHYDLPSKVYNPAETDLMLHALDQILTKAESSFFLVSPYFVPTQSGTDALVAAAQNGLNIIIITNSLASNDVFAVHGWYAKYRAQLLEAGIALYEVKVDPKLKKKRSWLGSSRTSLHAKTFIIDDQEIFVGSFNFDPRSAFINTEMGVLVHSPEFIDAAFSELDDNLQKSTYRLSLNEQGDILWHNDFANITYDNEPDASVWLRLGAWLASILPIENQL
ncbi:cardiolipin synthetase [Photobacterium aquae]|uniref:Cardiolipin synthetase n=1 Tax=Photobacterium aquae TaxID=1195763 RepID=A0A0J1H011_9GAMM|nr:cardiolipin synthetase [Photobacterium aquae]